MEHRDRVMTEVDSLRAQREDALHGIGRPSPWPSILRDAAYRAAQWREMRTLYTSTIARLQDAPYYVDEPDEYLTCVLQIPRLAEAFRTVKMLAAKGLTGHSSACCATHCITDTFCCTTCRAPECATQRTAECYTYCTTRSSAHCNTQCSNRCAIHGAICCATESAARCVKCATNCGFLCASYYSLQDPEH